jgi:hypothetical protein
MFPVNLLTAICPAFTDVSARHRALPADHAQRRSWPGSGAAASHVQFAGHSPEARGRYFKRYTTVV